ncbi:MAG: DUF6498-containing protein [Parafilimonas sp.]
MTRNKIFSDYTFWLLIATNVYLLLYYLKFPDSINDLIIIFWIQSVLIGIFNFLDMLTLKNFAVDNSAPVKQTLGSNISGGKGCFPLFFLFHYGAFHLVYAFFLVTLVDIKKLDFRFIELSFFIILFGCIVNFVQNKIRNRTEDVNIGAMFFLPYARVIPMHLMILLPKFFNISGAAIFLVLKTLADVIMYFVYTKALFKPPEKATEELAG